MAEAELTRVAWGIVLRGDVCELEDWKAALKQPFDPWVTEMKEGLILRSRQLEAATTNVEAYDLALPLMDRANGALAASHRARIVQLEAIAEVLSNGSCRRHFIMRADPGVVRIRAAMAVAVLGPDGTSITAPPEASNAQRWLSIAATDDLLADALTFFGRGDDWFDTYKALECLMGRFGGGKESDFLALGWASAGKIKLLKQTADLWRHSPRGRPKVVPPPNPMGRTEARDCGRIQ